MPPRWYKNWRDEGVMPYNMVSWVSEQDTISFHWGNTLPYILDYKNQILPGCFKMIHHAVVISKSSLSPFCNEKNVPWPFTLFIF